MVVTTELYDVLEVSPSCSSGEIKAAYRRLAMLHHPDKNEDASHEKFQAIQGAYETLADPEKRAAYDNYGSGGSNAQSEDPFGYSGRPHGFDDIFESMFGNDFFGAGMGSSGAGPSQPRKKRKTRGDDQKIELTVTLEEAYSGKEKKLEIEKRVICPKCEGSGCKSGVEPKTCIECEGKGIRIEEQMLGPGFVTRRQVTCRACRGEGQQIRQKDSCKKCKGLRTVPHKQVVEVYVEKGAREGDRIVLRGEGQQYPGQQPGDIILVVRVKAHPTFTLASKSSHLKVTASITLSEALLGFERVLVTHLDGRGLRVRIPSPGQPGHRVFGHGDEVVIKGEGFPGRRSYTTGDLLVRIQVVMPTAADLARLTTEQTQTLESCLPSKRPGIQSSGPIDDVELHSIKHSRHGTSSDETASREDERSEDMNSEQPHSSGCYQQ